MKIIYEAFFITEPAALKVAFPPVHANHFYHHSTICFLPVELSYKQRLGEEVFLKATGRLTTNEVDLLTVEFPLLKEFPFLLSVDFTHITLSTAEGVEPKFSKIALKDYGSLVKPIEPIYVATKYGYFNGKKCVTSSEDN